MPALSYLSNLLQPQSRQPLQMAGTPHLLLRGIDQAVFLRQWGTPEMKVSLSDLKSCFILDFLMTDTETLKNEHVWIYEKKDHVLFFRREKLISHFKWSQFKKRYRRSEPTPTRIQLS